MPYFTTFEIKQGETRTLSIDFENRLPGTTAIAASGHSVSSTEFFSRTTDNTILGGLTPTVSGSIVSVVITNVLVAERYELTFSLTLNDATPTVIKETILLIGVEELSN